MKNLIFVILLASLPLFVLAKKEKVPKASPHVHGEANVSVTFEGLKGRVEFRSAAESVLGFEYPPHTEQDQFLIQNALDKLSVMDERVQFSGDLKCKFTKDKVERTASDKKSLHSDILATFDVVCGKSVLGSKIVFDFTSFSKIKNLNVSLHVDSLKKTAKAKGVPVSVELK